MCLYTKMIKNPKYRENKKNKGIIPECDDERKRYVPVGCGNCIECRKLRQREWKIRIQEELKRNKDAQIVTLTFNEESLNRIMKKYGVREANEVAIKAVREFTERWRKKYKKTIKHWLIVELGHKGTERVHMHGILWTKLKKKEIEERWKNGFVHVGYDMSERAVNYTMKYVMKVDKDHENFKGRILVSKGIGKGFIESYDAKRIKKENGETIRSNNGVEIQMPIYYKNKLYSEEEKEKLWIKKLDEGIMYVGRYKFDIKTKEGMMAYERAIMEKRKYSSKLGYGEGEKQKKYFAKKMIKNLDEKKEIHIFEDSLEKRINELLKNV